MKTDEVKLRLNKFIGSTIDMIFPKDDLVNKIKNTTARYWVSQNMYQVDAVLKSFADKNGELDVDTLVAMYEDTIFENGEFKLDMKKIIPQDMDYLKGMFPNKVVIFKKEDLYNIFI